ncbi:unnamed protein product [Mucor hiemalis]
MQSIFDIEDKEEDLYAILNCVDTSSPEQIKTEYKRLILLHHPDKKTQESSEQNHAFDRIKAAYDIVGDSSNRALYEQWRASSLLIPFSEFAKIGTHAQTVHWQSLPTQLTLTGKDETDFPSDLKTIRVPPMQQQLPRIQINKTSFWKTKEYTVEKNK